MFLIALWVLHMTFTSHAEPVRSNHGIGAGASGRLGYIAFAFTCTQPPPRNQANHTLTGSRAQDYHCETHSTKIATTPDHGEMCKPHQERP
jgi:hypothetical protein